MNYNSHGDRAIVGGCLAIAIVLILAKIAIIAGIIYAAIHFVSKYW
jgi:hypothetical protein